MTKNRAFLGLLLFIALGAFFFRMIRLDLRPMHHDEANQAVKFGKLLEDGKYRYDPEDHHGPSLYYLSIPVVRLLSGSDFAQVDEKELRLIPVLFGSGLVLLLLLLPGLGSRLSLITAGFLLALSPIMVYYSRFYIQETLLAFFILAVFAAGWRYACTRSAVWAAVAGFFTGMMIVTKETCSIVLVCIIGALLLSGNIRHLLFFLGTAGLVWFLFFSSFLSHLNGPLDSILAFKTYFTRAGDAGFHSHPWYYYVKMLVYSQYGSGPVWSEAFILVLALIGGGAVFFSRYMRDSYSGFSRFILFYTLLTLGIYSMIPYKTPWNILPFFLGIILLAGIGADFILKICRAKLLRTGVGLVLVAGLFWLGNQSLLANFKYYADPVNPYVYAHTSPDFLNLVRRLEQIQAYHPDGRNMLIKVIAGPYETWPLPWYLREFKQVGYWQDAASAGELDEVPIIISSGDNNADLQPSVQENYISEFYGLRPEVLLTVHIQRQLWETFLLKK